MRRNEHRVLTLPIVTSDDVDIGKIRNNPCTITRIVNYNTFTTGAFVIAHGPDARGGCRL